MMRPKNNLYRMLEIIYEGLTVKDFDELFCISGDEGRGKTNLGLWIVDWWLRKRYGKITPDMARKYIGMDSASFSKVLSNLKKYDCALNDEAADISSRSSMNKANKLYMVAYQIIRGDNLLTGLIIPSIFDLDSYFRKRRVRHLFHVDKRGKYYFWGGKSLRRLVEVNERFPVKNMFLNQKKYPGTRYLFKGTFPKYDGPLLEPYLKMKQEKMDSVRQSLYNELNNSDTLKDNIKRMLNEGKKPADLVREGIGSSGYVYKIVAEMKG